MKHVAEFLNEYDCNFNIKDIPVEEMEDVYTQMLNDRDALRDATAVKASAPLLNQPAADEEEAVRFVAPVPLKGRALCHHDGCSNQFRAGGVCSRQDAKRRGCRMKGCTHQAQKEGVCVRHGAKTKRCDH
jgi:hypothetical protein